MPLVMWSGGHDSTLALYRTLTENATSTERKRVTAMVVNHDQLHEGQVRAQARAREQIKNALAERNLDFDVREISITSKNASVYHSGVPQAVMWISIGALYVDADDKLVCGYIHGDDALTGSVDARGLFRALMTTLTKKSELMFPLENIEKPHVLEALETAKILQFCWTCEKPTLEGEPCGECTPCEHLDAARYILGKLRERRKISEEKMAKLDYMGITKSEAPKLPIEVELPTEADKVEEKS